MGERGSFWCLLRDFSFQQKLSLVIKHDSLIFFVDKKKFSSWPSGEEINDPSCWQEDNGSLEQLLINISSCSRCIGCFFLLHQTGHTWLVSIPTEDKWHPSDVTEMSGSRVDLKVVLLGKEAGGKTSLVERYLHDRFHSNVPYQNVSRNKAVHLANAACANKTFRVAFKNWLTPPRILSESQILQYLVHEAK